jgi:RNA polymerase sigma-70 factor (ECF subfamily)
MMAREEGLKYKEIAEILSISEKTVNAQMVLAIKRLTKRLGDIILFIL